MRVMRSRQDDIVEAATRLIREQGVHAASISGIIAASGASAGSIYHHFANKNEIVLAVARASLARPLQEAIAGTGDAALSPAAIFRIVVEMVRAGVIEPALVLQLWAGSSIEPHLRELLWTQLKDLRGALKSRVQSWLLARGVADAEARVDSIVGVTIAQVVGLLVQSALDPKFDPDGYAAEVTGLLEGLGRA